ncbi:MAG: helix-turn-helix transcriptional regulator [Deltaproteobacteria bacterium]|nr:helix-turn-helix transcriptional regulator [Deltaproteobacteria bacterium]
MTTKARKFLESKVGPLTLGKLLMSIRLGDEMSQTEFAEKLRISKSHLCDIEQDRKSISPERAARFARLLGYSEEQFVRLTLQGMLDDAKIPMTVSVKAA